MSIMFIPANGMASTRNIVNAATHQLISQAQTIADSCTNVACRTAPPTTARIKSQLSLTAQAQAQTTSQQLGVPPTSPTAPEIQAGFLNLGSAIAATYSYQCQTNSTNCVTTAPAVLAAQQQLEQALQPATQVHTTNTIILSWLIIMALLLFFLFLIFLLIDLLARIDWSTPAPVLVLPPCPPLLIATPPARVVEEIPALALPVSPYDKSEQNKTTTLALPRYDLAQPQSPFGATAPATTSLPGNNLVLAQPIAPNPGGPRTTAPLENNPVLPQPVIPAAGMQRTTTLLENNPVLPQPVIPAAGRQRTTTLLENNPILPQPVIPAAGRQRTTTLLENNPVLPQPVIPAAGIQQTTAPLEINPILPQPEVAPFADLTKT